MRFNVHFSDGSYDRYRTETPQEAYKQGSKAAIGKFIKSIKCYDYGRVYYTVADGFIDPEEKKRKDILKADAANLIAEYTRKLQGKGKTIYIGDEEYECYMRYNATTEKVELVDSGDYDKVYRTFSISITIEEDVPKQEQKHQWSKGVCTNCGASLFDVEDPSGFCEN